MITEAALTFLAARLDEDERIARAAAACAEVKDGRWFDGEDEINDGNGLRLATVSRYDVTTHATRHDPARVLREVKMWRRIILEYRTSGLDAVYAGTERETGFNLALSFVLKSRVLAYSDHPDYSEALMA